MATFSLHDLQIAGLILLASFLTQTADGLAIFGFAMGFPPTASDSNFDIANFYKRPNATTSSSSTSTPCGTSSSTGKAGCPFNMCCSKDGYCGNNARYCSTDLGCQSAVGSCEAVPAPTCATSKQTASSGRRVGYYSGSNVHVRACNVVWPEDLESVADKYTHLYYTFANINPSTFAVEMRPEDNTTMYRSFTALGSFNSSTNGTSGSGRRPETWIAVGGGTFSSPDSPTHTTWSDMASTTENRAAFIKSLVEFMDEYGFQGVDLDWEFPGFEEHGGTEDDTDNYTSLVKDMRAVLGDKYGISLVIPHEKAYLVEYDLVAMEPYIDSFGFMAYDLHGVVGNSSNENTADDETEVAAHADIREIADAMSPLWSAGIDPAKVTLGLPYYGRGYTLKNKTCTNLDCPATGPSIPGKCAQSEGVLMLSEIQDLLNSGGAKSATIPGAMMKKLLWDGDQWVGYDDQDTMKNKTRWADGTCLGGVMEWSLDQSVLP